MVTSLDSRASSKCQLDLPGLDRPTLIDFAASTGPERPTSIDLGASTYPERPTSIDFGPILHSIFVVFRCHVVRATRRAARCAEPSFLLAGAVLRRVCTHSDNAENRAISSKHRPSSMFSIPSATQPRFSSPRHAPGCSRALLLVPRGDLGDSLGSAEAFQGRPKTLSRRSWDGLGALLGANGVPGWLHRTPNDPPRSTLDRFCGRFSLFFEGLAAAVVSQNRSTWAIAWAASPEPHRPGRIALVASPWSHRLGRIALAAPP